MDVQSMSWISRALLCSLTNFLTKQQCVEYLHLCLLNRQKRLFWVTYDALLSATRLARIGT